MKENYLKFWKSVGIVLLTTVIVGIMPRVGQAQGNTNLFAVVEFMKVEPGQEGNYLELEQKIWKPIHQERVNQGKLFGWILYQVMYTGTDDAYNYATVNVYANSANFENPYDGIDFAKVHPGKDMGEEFTKTINTRKLVKSQLISRVTYANPGGGENTAPHKYIVVNFMKSKPGGNLVQLETEMAKPTSEELIKSGTWAGWSLWSNVFPRGAGMESDFVTVDNYPDFSKLGSANYMQAFTKANPGKDWAEFANKAANARVMVRSELWKLVDAVFAGQ
ncbi:MAG TPA: hypothetical protein VKA38_05945 [Draconibacterium sp.]|nr:hypothetical protein [Draconibacterium sp.]